MDEYRVMVLSIKRALEAFNIWCSIIQFMGGFFSIISYILFFLVSLIGIPHGFFDFSIGKNIFQRFRKLWLLYFVSIYILITFFYFSIFKYKFQ